MAEAPTTRHLALLGPDEFANHDGELAKTYVSLAELNGGCCPFTGKSEPSVVKYQRFLGLLNALGGSMKD